MVGRERPQEGGGARTAETPATPLGAKGRCSATHKKTAIFGWLAFVVAAFAIGNVVGTKPLEDAKAGSGESGHVDSVLFDEFKQAQGDSVLLQSKTKTVDDPAFRAAIDDVSYTVAGLKQVKHVESPLEKGNDGQISKDRHSALLTVELRTTDAAAATTLDEPVQKALAAAQKRHDAVAIDEFGINATTELDEAVAKDFQKA